MQVNLAHHFSLIDLCLFISLEFKEIELLNAQILCTCLLNVQTCDTENRKFFIQVQFSAVRMDNREIVSCRIVRLEIKSSE